MSTSPTSLLSQHLAAESRRWALIHDHHRHPSFSSSSSSSSSSPALSRRSSVSSLASEPTIQAALQLRNDLLATTTQQHQQQRVYASLDAAVEAGDRAVRAAMDREAALGLSVRTLTTMTPGKLYENEEDDEIVEYTAEELAELEREREKGRGRVDAAACGGGGGYVAAG
ncbi:hypothetical protein F4778DRAFT_740145 [Xylariomycetidae sp. FL2044]|nr:hypothetical protein F4778DRAFT_740145 [Xylariomycetidae sp. FL2044]